MLADADLAAAGADRGAEAGAGAGTVTPLRKSVTTDSRSTVVWS
ncbi:hypothetical protein [Mycobacterium sp. DL592]|nr:hypothetical protein [Mycobacterium sp. DL592]